MATRREEPRRRRGCLGPLVALVWLVVAVVGCYALVLRPYVSNYLGEQLAERFGGSAPSVELPSGAGQVLPTVVAALPPGEFTVTEEQANEYLQANSAGIAQVESVNVRFVPNQVQANVRAAGTDNLVTMGLAIQNGRIAVTDPRIDGPLGAIIAPEQLVQGLVTQLNNELTAQGKPPTDVRIEQGQVVVTLGSQ